MIEISTVLVLGAGASQPFGFPTGRELVRDICRAFEHEENSDFQLLADLGLPDCSESHIKAFKEAMFIADPPSVDAWLEHKENKEFRSVGKAAIAIMLLQKEKRGNLRPEKNWYYLLFQALSCPFERFEENNLSIVTFNYDRSLEMDLYLRLTYTYHNKQADEYLQKLNAIKIVHIYGSLGRLPFLPDNPEKSIPQVDYGATPDYDITISARQSIRFMVENDKDVISNFSDARKLIEEAQALYFLGFGYAPSNIERLGVETLQKPFKVMGTCLGLRRQRCREIERFGIRDLRRGADLMSKSVYEFLYDYVDFNSL